MSAKPPAGKKSTRGGAPEWHFADEVDAGETEASNRAWTFFAKHKFVFRASAVLVLLIGFICMLDFKESKYLLRSNNAGKSSWYVTKPHWQTPEELRVRLRRAGPGPADFYPGQDETEEDHWLNDVDTEEWLHRMDTVAALDAGATVTSAVGKDDVFSDYDGVYDYA
eukprot:jgi/Tetstr1/422641/TSEL_013447.t1